MSRRGYAIACGHEKTLEVAEIVLQEGGNAVDAAIAAYMAAFITEPCMASAGGGGFAVVGMVESGEVQMVDFFCHTPKHKDLERPVDYVPIEVDFGDAVEVYYVGLASVATPGSIAGMYALHRLYGSIPMRELIQPAIELARNGVEVDRFQAVDFHLLRNIFKQSQRGRELFYQNGQIKQQGDRFYPDRMADFLDALGREGQDLFYKGEIADRVARDMAQHGGFLTREDFEDYRVNIRRPLSFSYNDVRVFTTGYPSLGGALMNIYLANIPPRSPHIIAFDRKVRAGMICDSLLKQPERISEALEKINPDAREVFQGPVATRGTSHLSVIDGEGNAIGITFSIGEGSSYFIPDTDIHMNNMLGEPSLVPNGPHTWPINVRLMSMMCPTLVRGGELGRVILGSGGASRIPYMISQVIEHLGHGERLEEAIRQPRMHVEDGVIQVEPGLSWLESKESWKGYRIQKWSDYSMYFGGVHAVRRRGELLEACGDFRRHGVGRIGYVASES